MKMTKQQLERKALWERQNRIPIEKAQTNLKEWLEEYFETLNVSPQIKKELTKVKYHSMKDQWGLKFETKETIIEQLKNEENHIVVIANMIAKRLAEKGAK